jgi:hypothetical protein
MDRDNLCCSFVSLRTCFAYGRFDAGGNIVASPDGKLTLTEHFIIDDANLPVWISNYAGNWGVDSTKGY